MKEPTTVEGTKSWARAAALVVLASVGACGGRHETSASSRQAVTTSFTLLVSTSSTRSSAIPLAGAHLSVSAYLFTSDGTGSPNPNGIAQVRYWLDDTAMSGAPTHVESYAPFDFVGTASGGTADVWTTSSVAAGTHTITQSVTPTSGVAQTYTASFTVGSSTAGNYVGCYTDSSTRALPDALAASGATVESSYG